MKDSLVDKVLGRKAIEDFPAPDINMTPEARLARWNRVKEILAMDGLQEIYSALMYVGASILDKIDAEDDALKIKRLRGQYTGLNGFRQTCSFFEEDGEAALAEINAANKAEKERLKKASKHVVKPRGIDSDAGITGLEVVGEYLNL